jgi:hypothetical protein
MTVRKGGYTMKKDVYGEPKIIRKGNIVAKVYSPILTDEEREKRMEKIKQASIRLILSKEK